MIQIGIIRTNNNEDKENIIISWFEPDINDNDNIEHIKEQLYHINDYVLFYSEFESCVNSIQSNDKYNIRLSRKFV